MNDVRSFLRKSNKEIETNQGTFRIKYIFWGISLKDWFGSNFGTNKYTNLNHIINKYCMNFYIACWDNRNEKLYDKDEQRRRVIDWYRVE